MRARVAERPRPRVNPRAVFGLASGRWAWTQGVKAGIAMSVSFSLVSVLFDASVGALAALGSMTALYERNTPYPHRAGSLALIAAGFVASVAVGSLSSVTPWSAAVAIGAVAGAATWLCQSLRVEPPGPFYFVLVCAIATIVPGGIAETPRHAGVAAVGAGIGWLVSMSGALFPSRRPQDQAVAAAFRQLGALLRAVGTPRLDHVQHEASLAVATAWRVALQAQTRGYRDTARAARLRALLRWVSDIHLTATEVALARTAPLPAAADFADALARAVARPDLAPDPEALDEARRGLRPRSLEARLYRLLARTARGARRTDHGGEGFGEELYDRRTPPLRDALRSGWSRDSLVRPTALRMGITVTAAGALAILLGFDRFYWVSVTAASVLQGGNVVLTANRSAQRATGTVIGVVAGGGILALSPPLPVVIAAAALLQALAQTVISRSFFYASIALTPMALLLAHTAAPYPVDRLVQERVVDTVVGSLVGIAGALLLWRRASASRLPQAIATALRTSRRVLSEALDPDVRVTPEQRYRLRRDLRADLLRLRGVYDSAVGDVPRAEHTAPLWPVVVAVQRTGYLALATLTAEDVPPATHITLQRLGLAFDELAEALRERRAPRLGALPSMADHPRLAMELRALAAALRTAAAGTRTTRETGDGAVGAPWRRARPPAS
ncbi:FUSC family protein [Thermobifida halotolerans]|uniref:FUSC family protein n=1 Tax=Thermobifida halotolerans TaxID=483545 RepID=A0AA97M1M2_9ACTN|nr:FUSC family protein [Thermobifida halotolerans]UOE21856.1 FUSC family protein [Thermobifida halotolerans]